MMNYTDILKELGAFNQVVEELKLEASLLNDLKEQGTISEEQRFLLKHYMRILSMSGFATIDEDGNYFIAK